MSKPRDGSRWRSRIRIPQLIGITNSSDGFTFTGSSRPGSSLTHKSILRLETQEASDTRIFRIETALILKFHWFVEIVSNISIYLMWFEMTRSAPKWSRSDRRTPIKPTEDQELNCICTYSEICECQPPDFVPASDLRLIFNSWSEIM